MQFQTTRENLLAGVTTVVRAVNPKSPVAALSGILFEAATGGMSGQDQVSLTGSNLDLTIWRTIPAQVTDPGAYVIGARQLAEIVRRLPDVPVVVTADSERNSVELSYANNYARLNGFHAAEFPRLADRSRAGAAGGGERLSITAPSKLFHNLFRRVIYAVGTDDLRPIFTGVLLEVDEGEIRTVATDTHRLAMHRVDYEGEPENRKMQVIVSGRALGELVRVLSQAEEELFELSITESYVMFSVGPIRILSRLIVGTYPDYRQIMPRAHHTRVSGIEASLLLQMVERAATLAQDGSPVINLQLGSGVLKITAQSEAGSIHEEMPVDLTGQELEISFNAKYLEEALRWCESAQLVLEFHGPAGPVIIRPLGDRDTYLALVLPVRLF
jgi:DNA polymerase-3 subunit beta